MEGLQEAKKVRFVTITGGSGGHALVSGLKQISRLMVRAIVAMADSGGSSGRIARSLDGALPPGDVLKILLALSDNSARNKVLQHRLKQGDGLLGKINRSGLEDHSVGNVLLAGAQQTFGSFQKAIEFVGGILNIREDDRVIPATVSHVRLCAENEDGKIIREEYRIDLAAAGSCPVRRAWLEHRDKNGVVDPQLRARVTPEAKQEINHADVIVIGPGDFWSSIMQVLLVPGVRRGIQHASAPVVLVLNATTKRGETTEWTAKDFVAGIEKQISRQLDLVVANDPESLSSESVQKYAMEGAVPVAVDVSSTKRRTILVDQLLIPRPGVTHLVRHDGRKIGEMILAWLKARERA